MTADVSAIEGDLIFYSTGDGTIRLEVVYQDETFWLSQKRMAELFGVDVRTISEHLQNIFRTGGLDEAPTIRKFRTVQDEGRREVARDIEFYHLDAIIAVGYRVNSRQATQFRIWATRTLLGSSSPARCRRSPFYTANEGVYSRHTDGIVSAVGRYTP